MEQAVRTMLGDLERSGPEGVGAPVRSVALLACDAGGLFPATADPLARRRRRSSAARLARRALSLATAVHGLIADRPDTARAWSWNARQLGERLEGAGGPVVDAVACVRALSRVAELTLELPALSDDEDWQAGLIAFADEHVLADLHEAAVELAARALAFAAAP
jgi:hypothetical protein